jgi:ArsR family transcriptional regulator, arsenate/arsenite/antimonite-responsive transcriptional repressor
LRVLSCVDAFKPINLFSVTTKKQKTKLAGPARAFRDCLPLFQAFGDIGRQDIILLLAEVESMNVNQIAEQLTLSRPTISHHLKTLRGAGLVSSERRGTENFYTLRIDAAVDRLKELIVQVEASCG